MVNNKIKNDSSNITDNYRRMVIKLKSMQDLSASINNDEVWHIIKTYFKTHSLAHHQIQTFNDAIYGKLDEIINHCKTLKIDYADTEGNISTWTISFGTLFFKPPEHTEVDGKTNPIFPTEC